MSNSDRVAADESREPDHEIPRAPIDWRGWIILAWALWFGLLYGKMMVEQRGGKLREWIATRSAFER